jgi:hypothetical protein
MTRRSSPSLTSIVKTDFLALLGALSPPIGSAIAVVGAFGLLPDRSRSTTDRELVMTTNVSPSFWTLMAAGFLVLGVVLIAWRSSRIRAAFASSHRVPGRITRLTPFKDRAYVHYEYRVDGRAIATRHFVHQTARFKRLREGQEVMVAVNPRRPSTGFVVELFEK